MTPAPGTLAPPANAAGAATIDLSPLTRGLARLDQRLTAMNRGLCALRRRVATMEAIEAQRRRGLSASRPIPEFRSQNGEDAFLWDLFADREGGFFIEAGAFDGYSFSVSYAFECVGWSGLLVEPIPAHAAACAARRPHSRTVQGALSRPGAPNTAEFTIVGAGEMLSYLNLSDGHRQRLAREGDLKPTRVKVPVSTLDSLLASHSGPIDFVVLDVEGGETDVLLGFDVARWRPRALLIEDNSMGKDGAVAEALAPFGYRRVATIEFNDLYLHEADAEMHARLARLA